MHQKRLGTTDLVAFLHEARCDAITWSPGYAIVVLASVPRYVFLVTCCKSTAWKLANCTFGKLLGVLFQSTGSSCHAGIVFRDLS